MTNGCEIALRARTEDLSTSGLAGGRTSRAESGTVVRFTMDFHGQVLAERMYQIILVMAGIIAFVAGYTSGSFDTMAHVFFCGLIVAVILCVPDWNYFNQHPVKWLPIDEEHPDWETVYKPQLEEKQGKGKAETKKKR